MKRSQFLRRFYSPLPEAKLKLWPNGNITQKWADNPHLYSKFFGLKDDLSLATCGHTGIDIVTHHGDPVYACHDGKVMNIVTTRNTVGGLVVRLISHWYNGEGKWEGKRFFSTTAYAHLDEIFVKVGDQVKAGETILGTEGNTGFVISGGTPYWGNAPGGAGTHLHLSWYEWNEDKTPRFPNCMRSSSDPLLAIMDQNPNFTGLKIYLENAMGYLRAMQRKLEGLKTKVDA